jgi:hypothetical protein
VTEGFGILAMASICPIIAVLAFGLALKARSARRARWAFDVTASEEPS